METAQQTLDRIGRLAKLLSNDDSLECPHCGHKHRLDGETCSAVVSYWGDDLHDFNCSRCGEDFIVREIVTRKFETAKTADDLE